MRWSLLIGAGRSVVMLAVLVLALLLEGATAWAQVTPGGLLGEQPAATPEQLAVLERVLARPEFQVEGGPSTLDRLLDPIRGVIRAAWRELERWWYRLLDGQAVDAAGGWFALSLVLLGTAVILRLARGTLATEARLADGPSSGPPRAAAELARAAQLAASGDLRGAVHHRYLAVLRRLDERELIHFDRALTNRELLPRAATRPALQATLAPLVDRFDRLWYGQSSCSAAEYEAFARLADAVWRAAA